MPIRAWARLSTPRLRPKVPTQRRGRLQAASQQALIFAILIEMSTRWQFHCNILVSISACHTEDPGLAAEIGVFVEPQFEIAEVVPFFAGQGATRQSNLRFASCSSFRFAAISFGVALMQRRATRRNSSEARRPQQRGMRGVPSICRA